MRTAFMRPGYLFLVTLALITQIQPTQTALPTPLKPLTPSLQTGLFLIFLPDGASQSLTFNVTLRETISNFRVSVSIQNINGYAPSNKVDFAISAHPFATWFEGKFVMDPEARWKLISASYVASGREDFIVGNFIVESAQLADPALNNSDVSLVQKIPVNFALHSNHYFAMVFLSGLRSSDLALQTSFKQAAFNSSTQKLTFVVTLRYDLHPIEHMSICYLVFHMRELDISRVQDMLAIPKNIDSFLGISDVKINSSLFLDGSGLKNQGRLLASPVNIQAFQEMFGVKGIMVQTQRNLGLQFGAAAMLIPPPQSTEPVVKQPKTAKEKCFAANGEMVYTQPEMYSIQRKCLICPQNSRINNSSQQCECNSGYIMANRQCLRKIICLRQFIYDAKLNSCVCPKGKINVFQRCIDECKTNEILFGGSCVCAVKYFKVNGKCTRCAENASYNGKTQQCVCNAGYEGDGLVACHRIIQNWQFINSVVEVEAGVNRRTVTAPVPNRGDQGGSYGKQPYLQTNGVVIIDSIIT